MQMVIQEQAETGDLDSDKEIKQKESDRVYEDDDWVIVVSKTERASCLYGNRTQLQYKKT